MITKRSTNTIPLIRRFITSEHGENYWFNGAAGYVMECLGEKDYDYQFFAGLTGDVFTQVYPYDRFRGDGVTDYYMSIGRHSFVEDIINKCGYAATFIQEKQLKANREISLQTLTAYIDKGVPVICNLIINGYNAWIIFVGYEEQGKTLLFLTDNMTQPERASVGDVFSENVDTDGWSRGWLLVGEKKETPALSNIYREAIHRLLGMLTLKTDMFCFGGSAFRAWADEIDCGRYDGMKPEAFDAWRMYSTYVCNAATNGSCCHGFLDRAMEYNPNFGFLDKVKAQYGKMQRMWEKDSDGLEAIGGGFNITLETLQNPEKSSRIATKLREFADCADEVVRILQVGLLGVS